MHYFSTLLREHEAWLMRRVRDYALAQGFTRYTSTLEEAWRVSIVGLTNSITAALAMSSEPWELGPDDDFVNDPVAEFGVFEARMHRSRGVTLGMFMGLMKYYRQSYLDLVKTIVPSPVEDENALEFSKFSRFLERIFDRIEIAFCSEWSRSETVNNAIYELQATNRQMTNEKNRFLTIFESLPTAVFVLDDKGCVTHMNQVGARLVNPSATTGGHYYSSPAEPIPFPWLKAELSKFRLTGEEEDFEFQLVLAEGEERQVKVRFRKMQDVSFKFPGTVVIFEDITDLKRIEKELFESRNALQDQVSNDTLTGVLSRREILAILEGQVIKSKREGHAISVIMADLDHFKKVNDTYGHLIGDEVLRQAAQRMLSAVRGTDYVGRYGGEEFLILLPGCDRDASVVLAERIRFCIGDKNMAIPQLVTISLGVATSSKDKRYDAVSLVYAADQALYRAKKNGRNRVETAIAELPSD